MARRQARLEHRQERLEAQLSIIARTVGANQELLREPRHERDVDATIGPSQRWLTSLARALVPFRWLAEISREHRGMWTGGMLGVAGVLLVATFSDPNHAGDTANMAADPMLTTTTMSAQGESTRTTIAPPPRTPVGSAPTTTTQPTTATSAETPTTSAGTVGEVATSSSTTPERQDGPESPGDPEPAITSQPPTSSPTTDSTAGERPSTTPVTESESEPPPVPSTTSTTEPSNGGTEPEPGPGPALEDLLGLLESAARVDL